MLYLNSHQEYVINFIFFNKTICSTAFLNVFFSQLNQAIPTIREKLKSISRKSFRNSINNNDKTSGNSSSSCGATAASVTSENNTQKKDIISLTTTEMRRNIGSVTYFLDPKLFEENPKTRTYNTRELWLPIKDITVTATSAASVSVRDE